MLQNSVSVVLSTTQCLVRGSHSLYFCCPTSLNPQIWEDFSLVSVASKPLLSTVSVPQFLPPGYKLQSGPALGSGSSVPESQAFVFQKSEPKSKEKWRNSLSGQNAIISPRATILLGRGRWFAGARAISCLCRWQSPSHSGLKIGGVGCPWPLLDILCSQCIFTVHDLTLSWWSFSEVSV